MLEFSSIAQLLQIKIVEQMNYKDLKQFVISSNHGGDVLKLIRHKPVLEIQRLDIGNMDMAFIFNSDGYSEKWSVLRQMPILPRFKVSRILSFGDANGAITEISERAVFVPSGVILDWLVNQGFHIFLQLSEIFNIDGFCTNCVNVSDLISLSQFREIRHIALYVRDIPDDLLLLLQARQLFFHEAAEDRFFTTANLFLQQWFEKKRELEWFQLRYRKDEEQRDIREDILFSGVPFTVGRNFRQKELVKKSWKEMQFRKAISDDTFEKCNKYRGLDGSVYSIDRGDKKLMIVYFIKSRCLIAQECAKTEDLNRLF